MIIYQIKNKVDGKYYIGSSKQFKKRKERHLKMLRLNKHDNPFLQNAWNKYGENNFEFNILASFDNITRDELYDIEVQYVNKYNSINERYGYNIANPANKPPHNYTEERRLKMSLSMKGKIRSKETRKKLSIAKMGNKNPMFGKLHSEEFKNYMSEKFKDRVSPMKGKKQSEKFIKMITNRTPWNKGLKGINSGKNHPLYGKHLSEETKKKISESRKGKTAGENHPMFGRHHTEEAKEKNRIAHIGLYDGEKNPFYGKHHTKETLTKISETLKRNKELKYKI